MPMHLIKVTAEVGSRSHNDGLNATAAPRAGSHARAGGAKYAHSGAVCDQRNASVNEAAQPIISNAAGDGSPSPRRHRPRDLVAEHDVSQCPQFLRLRSRRAPVVAKNATPMTIQSWVAIARIQKCSTGDGTAGAGATAPGGTPGAGHQKFPTFTPPVTASMSTERFSPAGIHSIAPAAVSASTIIIAGK
jgi:hypothetical protein